MENWQFDRWSALIGLIAGVVLAFVLNWLRRPAAALWQQMRERVGGARRWVAAGIEGRYREELAQYAQTRHFGAGAAPLDAIFVPPRLLPPPAEPLPDEPPLPRIQLPFLWPDLAAYGAVGPLPTLSLEQAVTHTPRALFSAPAGCGKSTTLAFVALMCARAESAFLPDSLPIYAHLAELGPWDPPDADRPRMADDYLLAALQRRAGTLTADSLPSALRQALHAGRAVVLLDGWDELAPAERPEYTRWLADLLKLYPDSRFILTAPATHFGPLLDLGFVPFTLQPWTPAEATQLAQRWADALGATLPTEPKSQQLGAPHVPSLGFWRPGLTALDATLGLWLMLAGETPPPYQVPRYVASIRQILAPFGSEEANWPLEIGQELLGKLAREMDRATSRIASKDRLAQLIQEELGAREELSSRAVQDSLAALAEFSGLLVTFGKDRLVFATPCLFAFFWADNLVRSNEPAPAVQRLFELDWALPLSFYAQMTEAVPMVEQLLAQPAGEFHDSLFQAASWVANTDEREQWRRIILVRLAQKLLDAKTSVGIRERAVAALVSTGDNGVGYLLRQAAGSSNPTLRAAAAPGLGALALQLPGRPGDEKSLEALTKSLHDPDEEVQKAAIYALAATHADGALEAIIQRLLEAGAAVRRVAAEALATMGDEGHSVLREALSDAEVLVRRAALYGLSTLDDDWASEKLNTTQMEDKDWFVRSTAEELINQRLKDRSQRAIKPLRPEDLGWLVSWAAERGEGVPAGPEAMVLVERSFEQRDQPAVRARAARSLGIIGKASSARVLGEAIRDPDLVVRETAIFALAYLQRAWGLPAAN